jgi:hypothetical protein
MAGGNSDALQLGIPVGTALGQLVQQVLPLKCELAGGDRDGLCDPRRPQLGLVERITARHRLGIDRNQVRVDRNPWLRMSPEPFQLRMVEVPTCFATQDSPGQQRLAPQGNQALRIEIPRVE